MFKKITSVISVGTSHIGYKYEDLSIYKWENPYTYHLKVLGEYVVCLSQGVLLIKESLNEKCSLLLTPQIDDPIGNT